MWKLYLNLYIITTCILGVIIGKNGKNIDDIKNKSLVNRIIKVDQADVSVVMLLT
jgi:ribosomal protein S3